MLLVEQQSELQALQHYLAAITDLLGRRHSGTCFLIGFAWRLGPKKRLRTQAAASGIILPRFLLDHTPPFGRSAYFRGLSAIRKAPLFQGGHVSAFAHAVSFFGGKTTHDPNRARV